MSFLCRLIGCAFQEKHVIKRDVLWGDMYTGIERPACRRCGKANPSFKFAVYVDARGEERAP